MSIGSNFKRASVFERGYNSAPNPYRGQPAQPGHIPWIAEGVAKVRGAQGNG